MKLINFFLSYTSFQVKLNNEKLKAKINKLGSLSGSSLFNFHSQDIPEYPKNNLALIADDAALQFLSYYAFFANALLKNHVKNVFEYYKKLKIIINANKTEKFLCIRKFTTNQIFQNFKIFANEIISINCGELDNRLNLHSHIKHFLGKVYAVNKYLYSLMKRNNKQSKT